jgi:protein involved in polysaccharide export with SLBB domain
MGLRNWFWVLALVLAGYTAAAQPPDANLPWPPRDPPILQLAPGDLIKMEVSGHAEMNATMYVNSDGTIQAPLAGPVQVRGLTPIEAAQRVEQALKGGGFMAHPQVIITVYLSSASRCWWTERSATQAAIRYTGRAPS